MKARMIIGTVALLSAGLFMGGGCGPEDGEPYYYVEDVCIEGTVRCAGSNTLEECRYDEWVPESCTVICDSHGMISMGCSPSVDLCECETPVNQLCVEGTAVFCFCREARGFPACTEAEIEILYQGCDENDPDYMHVSCMALFLEGEQVDCGLAELVCLE